LTRDRTTTTDSSCDANITGISGPVVHIKSRGRLRMLEVVLVGHDQVVGEVIAIDGDRAVVQVYEDTSGLRPGEPVTCTGKPLSVELGPGLISQVLDGIQRPLERIHASSGTFIRRGISAPRLDRKRGWEYKPAIKAGAQAEEGQILGTIPETPLLEHRVMIPPGVQGEVVWVAKAGTYTVDESLARIKTVQGERTITMVQNWEVRLPRPVRQRLAPDGPLLTGQRIIDTFFPLAKGGAAAIPGGFGTGKTITQNNLAKWCDADVIIYIGCGERGNEITGVLHDFPKLRDPLTGHPLMERTILIANTSNMPVAAREASIYTGVSLAEYFRDMGYHVAIMADSTSRWAEALREISGRLEEMPAEEGFPAYLATRLAEFYERSGRVRTLGGGEGSISIMGAVSPPGGDFTEPVTQHTKRFVRCFWALDKELASARFFPAINVIDSYSEYDEAVEGWWRETTGENVGELKKQARLYLREDDRLQQIVRLIGEDALPEEQKMIVLAADMIRQGFLQQNAYDKVDMFCRPDKQIKMLKVLLRFCDMGMVLVRKGIPAFRLREMDSYQVLMRMKTQVANEEAERLDQILKDLEQEIQTQFPLEDWETVSGRSTGFYTEPAKEEREAPE